MSRAGSEILFEDLRDRYKRAMQGHELTSPPATSPDPLDDDDAGFELIEHPTGEIDPLEDYLEMHALASGAYPVVDGMPERSDPQAEWGHATHDLPAPIDTPPPRAFSRNPWGAPAARHPSPPPAPPRRMSIPSQPQRLRPPTNPGWDPQPAWASQPPPPSPSWSDLPPDPGASLPQGYSAPNAPRNQRVPVQSPYSRAYGRTIPPTHPDDLYPPAPPSAPTNPTFPPPRTTTHYPLDPAEGRNPHRWDAWILAGFAIGGIWALALIRLFY